MKEVHRRTLLLSTGAAAVGVGAAGLGITELLRHPTPSGSRNSAPQQPNILVIVLDQLRSPQWFPALTDLDTLLPHMAQLRRSSVSFESHYTASTMCTPSRGALTTGLYSHQTGCLYTLGNTRLPLPKPSEIPPSTPPPSGESTLSSQFPTWGTLLREKGYRTWWWGKWHLGNTGDTHPDGLEEYGFSGGTYPSPNGGLGEGLLRDPDIVQQFTDWFDRDADRGPWCTTVSLVNPHDIAWWPRWSTPTPVPRRFHDFPPNFETPEQLLQRRKPSIQRDMVAFFDTAMTGHMPTHGDEARHQWAQQLDVYLWLQQQVDTHVGAIVHTLAQRPEIDQNTIVIFTSDHGEYAGSHGLSGKGGSAYEEAIRVPLFIRDPSGYLTPHAGDLRHQLTSSVDIAPLLLTIAHGSPQWRNDPRYSHLCSRADIADIAHNPRATGRPWIAHVTDDLFVEEVASAIPPSGPDHLIAVRTPHAKLGVYTSWIPDTMNNDPTASEELELYDYSTPEGTQEIDNRAGTQHPLEKSLRELYTHEVLPEIHADLPPHLTSAREEGLDNMLTLNQQRAHAITHFREQRSH